jgi:signal transduction histidine kinase
MGHPDEREAVPARVFPPDADAIRAQRMDAASGTAAALAHQFANYLGTMRAMVDLLGAELPRDPEAAQDLEVLQQCVEGAMRFVDSLRGFTHPQPLGMATIDVNAALREAEPRLRALLPAGRSLELRLAPGSLEARSDEPRLGEVVADLVAALAAGVPEGGVITLETARPDAASAGREAAVIVAVRAPGVGPAQERASRLFEPFGFDTSYDGGLRLPTVYAAVVRSGGAVAGESVPGGPTTIRVTLPAPIRRSGEQAALR